MRVREMAKQPPPPRPTPRDLHFLPVTTRRHHTSSLAPQHVGRGVLNMSDMFVLTAVMSAEDGAINSTPDVQRFLLFYFQF